MQIKTKEKLTYRYLGRQFMGRHMVERSDGQRLSITNAQLARFTKQNRITK